MKKATLIAMAIAGGCFVSAQSSFVRNYSSAPYSTVFNETAQTTDGGFIACGDAHPGSGYSFTLLVKTGSNGDTLWTRHYRLGVLSTGSSVQQTSDGGYVVTGYSCPATDWLVFPIVIKMDANGDIVWAKQYGIGGTGQSIRQTPDGGYVVAGHTSTNIASTGNDVFLLRLDAAGNTSWVKTYGGASSDNVSTAVIAGDGGIAITGWTVSYGAGDQDVYLMKTDSLGNFLWWKTYGRQRYEWPSDLEQTSDSGFILTGHTSLDSLNNGLFLIKTGMNGDTLWTNIYGANVQRDRAIGQAVKQTTDSGYIVAGDYYVQAEGHNLVLLKVNAAGAISWSTFYGDVLETSWSRDVLHCSDGGYLLSGSSASFGNPGGDAFLVKTDPSGFAPCFDLLLTIADTFVPWIVTSPVPSVAVVTASAGLPAIYSQPGMNPAIVCFLSSIISSENESGTIDVFPNPAADQLTVQFNTPVKENVTLRLLDLRGQLISTGQVAGQKNKAVLSLDAVADGVYILQVATGEMITSRKIVVQH